MKLTKIEPTVQTLVKELLNRNPKVAHIADQIDHEGGRALLVGGAVRDLLSKRDGEFKDLDIEVHGLTLEQLQKILSAQGTVSVVGKAFGVLRLHGLDIDWSLPRADSAGRHPAVIIDPHMNIADAFKRRDLTINAMGIDLKTFELIDPWNGYADLRAGILRAPDENLFVQDPLRLFRVMQLIGRFGMKPDAQLNNICKKMSLAGVSVERIESEFDKLFLKSARPSLGLRWLKDIGRIEEFLPELAATIGVEQNLAWHPEGDVFEHTMQAIDAGAALTFTDDQEKLTAMYGILCHDLGKVSTTRLIDGVLRSLGHEDAGVEPTKKLLKRFTRRVELIDAVAKIVKHHMAPVQFVKEGAKPPAYKRLALKLSPEVTMDLLARVSLADKRGRNGASHLPLTCDVPEIDAFIAQAKKINVITKPEEPVVQGRDIMDHVKPGPEMGRIVKKAYEIQIEEGIRDKAELIKRILGS